MDGRSNPVTAVIPFLLVTLVAALLFFGRLGCPLQEPQEPRYAEISRQMLAEGRIAVPVYYGMAYLDKPPLLYWLVMASYQLFGVHDWAARLVPSLAGFLTVLLAYGWARRIVGNRAALLGTLMLCLSVRFVQLGRLLTTDSLLCLWVVAAWAAAHSAVQGGRLHWRWWFVSALACGLGLLTKGPVALVLIAVPVFLFQMVDRQAVRPRIAAWAAYLTGALAVAVPWYGVILAEKNEFGEYFFLRHHVERFLDPFDHAEPVWFYLPDVLIGMLPWTLLLPVLVVNQFRRPREQPVGLMMFLLASGWSLTFFSLAGCKRSTYILPAMPPFALALGCYLDALMCRRAGDVSPPVVLGTGGLTSPARRGLVFAMLLLTTVAGLVAVHTLLPAYARQYSLRGVARRHAETWPADLPVASYPRRWDSVSFYLGRNDVRVYSAEQRERLFADLVLHPETLVFVKSKHWLSEFLRDLPEGLEFVPHGRQGYVSVGIVRRHAK